MESVGFKEWAAVCEALGSGRQSIILRKGGIAEGREGFSFKHREFYLFPTWFHEQPEKVRYQDIETRQPNGRIIEIRYAAAAEILRAITSWSVAEALAPLHILKPEVVRERFEYDEAPGLHVAFVRAYQVEPRWSFPNEKRYGGCRSWVPLPDVPNDLTLNPVLDETEHNRRKEQFLQIVG